MQLSAREAVLHDFNGKRGPYRAMQPRSIDCQARFFSKCAAIVPPTPKRKKGYKHKLATLLFYCLLLVRLPESNWPPDDYKSQLFDPRQQSTTNYIN